MSQTHYLLKEKWYQETYGTPDDVRDNQRVESLLPFTGICVFLQEKQESADEEKHGNRINHYHSCQPLHIYICREGDKGSAPNALRTSQ